MFIINSKGSPKVQVKKSPPKLSVGEHFSRLPFFSTSKFLKQIFSTIIKSESSTHDRSFAPRTLSMSNIQCDLVMILDRRKDK